METSKFNDIFYTKYFVFFSQVGSVVGPAKPFIEVSVGLSD